MTEVYVRIVSKRELKFVTFTVIQTLLVSGNCFQISILAINKMVECLTIDR